MDLTNESYVIWIGSKTSASKERYYRDAKGWVKVSMRGRTFRMTAEQVLNHVLPALAGLKPNVTIRVEHRERRPPEAAQARSDAPNPRHRPRSGFAGRRTTGPRG